MSLYEEGSLESDPDSDADIDADYSSETEEYEDELSLPIFGQDAALPVAQ